MPGTNNSKTAAWYQAASNLIPLHVGTHPGIKNVQDAEGVVYIEAGMYEATGKGI